MTFFLLLHTSVTLSLLTPSIMNFDDDAPPELVEVSGGIQDSGEGVSVKVPITIVTGEILTSASKNYIYVLIADRINRISRSWKDDAIKLHTYGPTWQKDCRYYEWCVALPTFILHICICTQTNTLW